MLEVVQLKDLEDLLGHEIIDWGDTKRSTRKQAIQQVIEIIRRLPEPRAYILEPSYTKDDAENCLWEYGQDVLSSMLSEQNISAIDPETIRCLIAHCPALFPLLDNIDPFLIPLLRQGIIQEVEVPYQEEQTKHQQSVIAEARAMEIPVFYWRPRVTRGHH